MKRTEIIQILQKHAGDMEAQADALYRRLQAPGGYTEDFLRFWMAYPKKVGKGAAWKAWRSQHPPIQDVLDTLDWQRRSKDWAADGGKFIPHPSTYLNARRWEDERPQGRMVTMSHRDATIALKMSHAREDREREKREAQAAYERYARSWEEAEK